MAEQRHNKDASSLDAGNWPSGGFADDAELAVIDSKLTLTDLDRTGDTTTGIKYFHVRGGRPTIGDETEGNLKIECKEAYTAKPNLLWATKGGTLRVEFATTECQKAVFMAASGEAFVVSGAADTLVIAGSGTVHILAGVTVAAAIYVMGSAEVIIHDIGTIPALYVSENARVRCGALVAALEMRHFCWVRLDNQSGTDMTSCLLEGGRLVVVAGDIPSIEWWGGAIDVSELEEAVSLGTTSFEVKGSNLVPPAPSELLTVGTPVGTLPALPITK